MTQIEVTQVERSSGPVAGTGHDPGHVEFRSAGEAAVGEFRCSECGYGAIVQHQLPICPMCGSQVWEQAAWSPFTRPTTRR
jgi:rubrerythrin